MTIVIKTRIILTCLKIYITLLLIFMRMHIWKDIVI